MIIGSVSRFYCDLKDGKLPIRDFLTEAVSKAVGYNSIAKYVLCDPVHYELLNMEFNNIISGGKPDECVAIKKVNIQDCELEIISSQRFIGITIAAEIG